MTENKDVKEEEMPDVHVIPDNYTNSGRIINGMIELRNAVEGAIVSAVLGFIEYLFFYRLDTVKMFAIIVITIGPIFIASVVGISGDSISQFSLLFINYLKNKRKLRYRRIMKNAKTTNSRVKSKPINKKKKR